MFVYFWVAVQKEVVFCVQENVDSPQDIICVFISSYFDFVFSAVSLVL